MNWANALALVALGILIGIAGSIEAAFLVKRALERPSDEGSQTRPESVGGSKYGRAATDGRPNNKDTPQ